MLGFSEATLRKDFPKLFYVKFPLKMGKQLAAKEFEVPMRVRLERHDGKLFIEVVSTI